MDRSFWRVIANDENALPQGEWVAELTPELLSWLSSADPELRDEFAYKILAAWVERGQYTPDELRKMAEQMTANLQVGLGERDTETVFGRSFSVLILMEIVAYDDTHRFLERSDITGYLEAALSYLQRERDLRAYVEGPGWAYAVAHTADLLMMLARNEHLGTLELERLLDGVADRLLTVTPTVFVQHEDERLAYAALTALRRNLVGQHFLDGWLERLLKPPGREGWNQVVTDPAEAATRSNVRNFLRSLYFQVRLSSCPLPGADDVAALVLGALRKLDIGFYELS